MTLTALQDGRTPVKINFKSKDAGLFLQIEFTGGPIREVLLEFNEVVLNNTTRQLMRLISISLESLANGLKQLGEKVSMKSS